MQTQAQTDQPTRRIADIDRYALIGTYHGTDLPALPTLEWLLDRLERGRA